MNPKTIKPWSVKNPQVASAVVPDLEASTEVKPIFLLAPLVLFSQEEQTEAGDATPKSLPQASPTSSAMDNASYSEVDIIENGQQMGEMPMHPSALREHSEDPVLVEKDSTGKPPELFLSNLG